MYTLQNSKGETVKVDARFRTMQNGKLSVIDEESFENLMVEKHGSGLRFRGIELKNSNGDITDSQMGYNYVTDKLTYIRSKYVGQSFFEVAPADYFDVIVGEGAWAGQIITNMTLSFGTKFSAGNQKTGAHNSRQNVADAGIVPFSMATQIWSMGTEYSIADIQQAAFSGNWSPIEAKHKALKKLYDLGIQEVSFLGLAEDLTNFPGLYTQPYVNSNLTLITKKLSAMTSTELNSVAAGLVAEYRSNCNRAAWPTDWLVPEDDFLGLSSQFSETYPLRTKLEVLQIAFQGAVPNKKAKIRPMSYGMPAHNKTVVNVGTGKTRHVLYNNDADTLFQEIPVDFTMTAAGTLNNFNFQDAGYAQYSSVGALKPLEIEYFDF